MDVRMPRIRKKEVWVTEGREGTEHVQGRAGMQIIAGIVELAYGIGIPTTGQYPGHSDQMSYFRLMNVRQITLPCSPSVQ
jgi:hypothetical protein